MFSVSQKHRRVPAAKTDLACWVAAAVLCVAGCSNPSPDQASLTPELNSEASTDEKVVITQELIAQVGNMCGDCHAVPLPEHYPREAWRKEVEQGYRFYHEAGTESVPAPPLRDAVAYYEQLAPEKIEYPAESTGLSPGALRFRTQTIPGDSENPAVSYLQATRSADSTSQPMLLACDMRSGMVLNVPWRDAQVSCQVLAHLKNPAHITPCDLDGDGLVDLIISDLGSYTPSDHDQGAVVWLKRTTQDLKFEPMVLADKLGRVADAEPADFDADGDLDLIVAEFGWHQTGRVLLLKNDSSAESPRFTTQVIDKRHGAIHVTPVDFNADKHMDFFALLSQEHESIEIFHNDGLGGFRSENIFAADRPSFGLSGLELTDLDQDGDLDVLFTNGDLFDDLYLRTYHAVHWLENRGADGWADHELAQLAGVHRALSADMDGDGDKDVVACGFIPRRVFSRFGARQLDSLIWLEQTSTGKFVRHVLEIGQNCHAALAVDDFDQDGDIDMAVGNYATSSDDSYPLLTLWWNEKQSGQ